MLSVQVGLAVLLAGGSAMMIAALNPRLISSRRNQQAKNLRAGRGKVKRFGSQPTVKIDAVLSEVSAEFSEKPPQKGGSQSMERWLKYGGLSISPTQFRLISFGLMAAIYIVCLFVPRLNSVVRLVVAVWAGHLLSHSFVNRRLTKRFNAFDQDFAPFMMSLVGLSKTGMNIMTAIDAAAERLGPDSLFRLEVVRMTERLRFGVSEDHAIGAFAEGIDHPDVELFVQTLLLSRQVGGSLSETLERLARQARRRSQFRMQAHAAVGQQRGSIWVIIAIVIGIQLMMYFQMPEIVLAGLKSEWGFLVWQGAALLCWFAVWLVGKVTKIRV